VGFTRVVVIDRFGRLPLFSFAVMTHLLQTRLTDVDVRGSFKMIGTNFSFVLAPC